MPSMVAAAMTPLMPGAGPPPTRMPNLPLLLIKFRAGCHAPEKIQFHYCQKPTTICPMNRAVFLDRDGTMIAEKNYLCRPEDVEIFPATPAGLKRLAGAGFKLFIVSNQSGVGRGYFTMADVDRVNEHLCRELAGDGVRFEKIYIAPEKPGDPSRGRKPSPQFLFDARDEFDLDMTQSYLIGDKLIDLECGWNAGVKQSILVRTGYGAELERMEPDKLKRAVVVDDLNKAADWILNGK
jgi:D-glycero-D-manno-heptose 1,7-bisphosphate phosphatase